jgi:hypothetical protein
MKLLPSFSALLALTKALPLGVPMDQSTAEDVIDLNEFPDPPAAVSAEHAYVFPRDTETNAPGEPDDSQHANTYPKLPPWMFEPPSYTDPNEPDPLPSPDSVHPAEPYCWDITPIDPVRKCPNGVKSKFSPKCFNLNWKFLDYRERSQKFFKCPGLVEGW